MIPLDDVVAESPDTPLRILEDVLRSGRLRDAVERRHLGDSLGRVSHTLAEQDLQSSLASYVECARAAASEIAKPAEVLAWIEPIAGLGKALQTAQGREELLGFPEKVRLAASRRDAIRRELERAWSAWVTRNFEGPRRLADLLQRFSATRPAGERLRKAAVAGLTLGHGRLPTEEEVAQAMESVGLQQRILTELRTEEGTNGLLSFLDRVLAGSATLADVSPDLMNWLREHDALALLKVGF